MTIRERGQSAVTRYGMADTYTKLKDWLFSPGAALLSRRFRRIWLLMIALWIMNGFDLALTLQAHQQGFLVEANPIALAILPYGPTALSVFKVVMVVFGSYVLLSHHRRVYVECMAWLLALVYVGVSLQWMFCYEAFDLIVSNECLPHVNASLLG